MQSLTTPRQERQGEARRAPVATPSSLQTTLYDVMATLQNVVEPHADDLVVSIVARWLWTRRITFVHEARVAV